VSFIFNPDFAEIGNKKRADFSALQKITSIINYFL